MAQTKLTADTLSVADYLAGENDGAWRHEFINGHVFAMAGASERHGIIRVNVVGLLNAVAPEQCRVFDGDMKLRIERDDEVRFFYPDAFVSCGDNDDKQYFRTDALVVFEILSDSTRRLDRFEKFDIYKRLPSLLEYVLIEQDMPRVEVYRRRASWRGEVYVPGDNVVLESLAQTFTFDQIYRRASLSLSPSG